MKHPCKIQVCSARNLNALDLFPQAHTETNDLEEEWEEILLEEGFSPDEPIPTDRWTSPRKVPHITPPASSTLTAYGLFSHETDGSFRISYEDSEITGMEGCLTTFCLSPAETLIMLRQGKIKTSLVFENHHRHLCDYGLGGEVPSVVLHTHDLTSSLSEIGGKIFVDYTVEIRGTRTEHNYLSITVERL